MRQFFSIIDRALLNMMISDRGWLEMPSQNGVKHSKTAREEKRQYLEAVFTERQMEDVASKTEIEWIKAPVSSLGNKIVEQMIWYYESLSMLLWVAGKDICPVYDGKLTKDYHGYFAKYRYRTPDSTMRDTDNKPSVYAITVMRETTMLWHWRTIEGINNPWFQTHDVTELLRKTFGAEAERGLHEIAIVTQPIIDFAVNGKPYNMLDRRTAFYLTQQALWRHHALEWILGEESWEDTDSST